MKSVFHCQGPDHRGSRIIGDPFQQFEVSLDAMRRDGLKRLFRIHRMNLCGECGELMERKLRGKEGEQGSLL